MDDRSEVERLLSEHGYADWRWIEPKEIVVAQWVRMKCVFGCGNYGRNASCPPSVPPVAECRRFFDEYQTGVMLHFEKRVEQPEDRHEWSREVNRELLKLERDAFCAGFQKAFLLFMDSCELCAECGGTREACKHPRQARPSPESMAVDVFSTARKYGFPIEVLSDYGQAMNRYAFLLIE